MLFSSLGDVRGFPDFQVLLVSVWCEQCLCLIALDYGFGCFGYRWLFLRFVFLVSILGCLVWGCVWCWFGCSAVAWCDFGVDVWWITLGFVALVVWFWVCVGFCGLVLGACVCWVAGLMVVGGVVLLLRVGVCW